MPDDPETTGDDMVEGQRTIGAVDDDDSPTSENAVRKPPETNDAPEFAKASYTREVDENTGEEGKVGEPVMATDGDEDVLTYSLSGGADKDAFEIDNKGQITVGAGTELDYESSKKSYMVVVKAEDPFGESDTARVTITVMDVNEKPTLGLLPAQALIIAGQSSVNYEETDDAVVETYTADGAAEGATVTWTLSGDDADDFDISSGGELTFMALPDFEDATDADTDNVYEVTIEATDGTNADTHDVTVTVTDVEELGPGTVVERYDTDDNDEISGSEVIQAVRDYFAGGITGPEVLKVVRAYFDSR
jgi:serralysin